MTYSRSKKVTDTERKLQAIKTQLYGKEEQSKNTLKNTQMAKGAFYKFDKPLSATNIIQKDNTDNPLKRDLLKILFLSSAAIGIQVGLYLVLNLGIIKF